MKGALQVNAPPGFAYRHIAPHLPLIADQYQDIHLDLVKAENDSENTLSKVDIQIKVAETSHQENDWHFRINETTMEFFRAHGNLCLASGDAILKTVLNGAGLSMMST